jgi:hypothetical protein
MGVRILRALPLVMVGLVGALPATAAAKTYRDGFQLQQLTPLRIWQETSAVPFALPDPVDRVYRYRIGSRVFVGPWTPASTSVTTASVALRSIDKNVYSRSSAATQGVLVDRRLSARERRRFKTLAELYRDGDVLVVAAGHPACAGLTRAQARSIASGGVTRWSQVVAGAGADAIKVRYPVSSSGFGVPHFGAKVVGKYNKQRLNYARGAVGAQDGGVGAAAQGDQAIAAITTWSRVRTRSGGICVVPLDGVAPSDATVAGLRYPEAFPVAYVVLRHVPRLDAVGRAKITVMRRAMRTFLRSERLRELLRRQGLLVAGDPPG